MKIYFLGTNGWYDSKTGDTVCILIETSKAYFILDAGNAFYKIDQYIKKDKPVYLFLSHYHLDHVYGLHILNKFKFAQGIDIFGPVGLKKLFKTIINYPYSMPISDLDTNVRLHELSNKKISKISNVEFKELKHSVTCLGYRFNFNGKIVTYCTDTGICDNLAYLARDSDVLITECSYKSGFQNPDWPHLNPETAANAAKISGARRLVLVHFDAGMYPAPKDRVIAGKIARKIFNKTTVSHDGLVITF